MWVETRGEKQNGPPGPVFPHFLAEPVSYESTGRIRILKPSTPYLPSHKNLPLKQSSPRHGNLKSPNSPGLAPSGTTLDLQLLARLKPKGFATVLNKISEQRCLKTLREQDRLPGVNAMNVSKLFLKSFWCDKTGAFIN